MWKLMYCLTTIMEGENDPFEGRNNGEDEDENKEGETEKEKRDNAVEGTQQKEDDMETTEDQQIDQKLQDTQLLALSPPHDTNTLEDTIKVKDVPKILAQNINPLTTEDLKNILDQSTLQDKLCNNLVLVSVDEIQKVVADITRDKVNKQEPPFSIPTATSGQPIVQTLKDTSAKVDTTVKVVMTGQQTQTIEEPTNEQERQTKVSVPTAKTQGV